MEQLNFFGSCDINIGKYLGVKREIGDTLLWITFLVNLCSLYFCDFRKKGLRPKWTIYKNQSDNNRKCLSDNFRILSIMCVSVAHLQLTLVYVEVLNIY